jgi:hypothetical protein
MHKGSYKSHLVLISLFCCFWLLNFSVLLPLPGLAAPPAKPAQTNKNPQTSAGQPASNQPQDSTLPLAIQRIFLKANHVWVGIARDEKGGLRLEDYPHILIKVAGQKTTGNGQWTLAQVDPGHVLLRPNSKIEFNTKLVLKQPDRVTVTITFGSWKDTKSETLTPPSIATGAPGAQSTSGPVATAPQPNLPAQASNMPKPPGAGTPPTPVPRGGTFSGVTMQPNMVAGQTLPPTAPGGLTFSVPGAGQAVMAGDALYFILRFEHSIAEGDVTLSLRRVGSGTVHASHTYHYRPIEGEWSLASNFTIPDHSVVAADDYFLEAVHAAGNTGLSPVFTIRLRGTEGLIRILKPAARDVYNPGNLMRVNFQLTRSAASGLIRFDMFALATHRPVLSWTSDYHTPAADTPQPVYFKEIRLPDDLPFANTYFILATHSEGSGRSENFTISPLINHGGAEVVEDIAITDIVKDASGAIKVRARVTGAHFPIWVEWLTYLSNPTSILLYPGDNELTIDTRPLDGTGGECSRNYSVRLDPNNRYTETNETNNNLEKTIFFLDRNGRFDVRDRLYQTYPVNTLLRASCDIDQPYHAFTFYFVLHYCGTDSFNIRNLVREVRQSGRRPSTTGGLYDEDFDQSVTYRLRVSDHCDDGSYGSDRNSVAPGQCVFVEIHQSALTRVDSTVTLYLNEPAASWPGIRSPLTVRIQWGKRDGFTGECRYNP